MYHLIARSFLFSAFVSECSSGACVWALRVYASASWFVWLDVKDTSYYPWCISDPVAAVFGESRWEQSSKARNCRGGLCWHYMNRSNIDKPTKTHNHRWRSDKSHIWLYSEAVGERLWENESSEREDEQRGGRVRATQSHSKGQRSGESCNIFQSAFLSLCVCSARIIAQIQSHAEQVDHCDFSPCLLLFPEILFGARKWLP